LDEIIEIEGGEDDVCLLLLGRNLVPRADLEALIRERRALRSTGAVVALLAAELESRGLVPSARALQALRLQTKALAKCGRCGAFHAIFFHRSATVHPCARCAEPLRPRPAIEAGPAAQESLLGAIPEGGGETMLGMGPTPERPAPTPTPASQESLMGKLPEGGGETMLDLGARPPPPSPSPAAAPTAAPPSALQESILSGFSPGGGETMLDLGSPGGVQPPQAPPVPPSQESVRGALPPGGGETVLDLGSTPALPPSPKPPEAPRSEPTIYVGGESDAKADPTVLADTPRTRSSAPKSDPRGLEATPRTATGGGGRSYAPMKAAPKEVQEAARDW